MTYRKRSVHGKQGESYRRAHARQSSFFEIGEQTNQRGSDKSNLALRSEKGNTGTRSSDELTDTQGDEQTGKDGVGNGRGRV